MGREIRRVPPDWQHPVMDRGGFQPLHNYTFETVAAEWKAGMAKWEAGERKEHGDMEFWEWDGGPPDRTYCRPDFGDRATCYQVYETVSEGTPVSPVFATKDEMRSWLVASGLSEHAVDEFIRGGWAPSMMVITGGPHAGIYGPGIASLDAPSPDDASDAGPELQVPVGNE